MSHGLVDVDHPVNVDVRVIVATHRNLKEMVLNGEFRRDLYYRLSALQIVLPPLRRRQGDIHRLANHFCRELGNGQNVEHVTLLQQ